jgi:Mg/Co/Ni transporter MgtE
MDLKQRIKLLDRLQSLGVERKLPEEKVTALVTFLEKLPEDQRECILELLMEGSEFDQFDRLERFAELAMMPPSQRAKKLQAVGIEISAQPELKIDQLIESARDTAVRGFKNIIQGVEEKASKENVGELAWSLVARKFKKWTS